jgi:polyisoprenoid-binding protein YceI
VRIARDPSGKEVIPVVEVEVPVASMNTRNKSRDGQMREMFRSDRFPRIRGEARNVDVERIRVEFGKVRGGDVSIDLLLRIRDVERKVRATASNLRESGERVTFDLEFPLSLGEFGLKAPSVLGFIRVGDKVSVKATFTLTVSRSP